MDNPLPILFINHVFAPLSGLPSPRGGAVCSYRIAGAAERDRRELEDDPCSPSERQHSRMIYTPVDATAASN
jgi:hypothetical protein